MEPALLESKDKKLLQIFQNRKTFWYKIPMDVTFLKMPGTTPESAEHDFMTPFLNVYSQAPYMLEILIF